MVTGVALGVTVGTASAAPNGSTEANAIVESGITLTALTATFDLTGTPGATVESSAVTYNVETNNGTGYTVTVTSADATMLPDPTNGDDIPIAALTVREGTGPYTALSSTAGVTVHSQTARSVDTGDVLNTNYQMRIPTVAADTYSATLNYLAATSL